MRGSPAAGAAVLALLTATAAPAADTLALDRARMYARPSKEVWQAVQETLATLRLKTAGVDAAHQALTTKFRSYGGEGAVAPEIPGYKPIRYQLHVFVSPFAEPARVHVGSLSELQRMRGGTSTMYNGGSPEAWFLDALDRRLGTPGRAIPVDSRAREAQARDMGFERTCPSPGQSGTGAVPPRRIESTDVEILFPGSAAANAHRGTVAVRLTIGEDGAVYGMDVQGDTAPDQQFRQSALGALSLWRWVPAQSDGCAAPTVFTYSVSYGPARRGR
jgi:TonB family protein